MVIGEMRWQTTQQSSGVGMLRRGEDSGCGANFGDAAGVENENAIS